MENANAVFNALKTLGAPLEGLEATDLLTDDGQYQFRTEFNRVDLLTFIGEMPFDTVWRNRVDTEIDGVPVRFISKTDLIENKRQIGRLIDLADVEQLSVIPEANQLRLQED